MTLSAHLIGATRHLDLVVLPHGYRPDLSANVWQGSDGASPDAGMGRWGRGRGEGVQRPTMASATCDCDVTGLAWCLVRSSPDNGALMSFLRSLDGAVK